MYNKYILPNNNTQISPTLSLCICYRKEDTLPNSITVTCATYPVRAKATKPLQVPRYLGSIFTSSSLYL